MRQYQWQRRTQMTQQATEEASAAADLVPLPSEPHVSQPPGDAPSAQAEATPMALEGQPAAEDVPIPGSSSGPTTMSQSNVINHFTFIVQELPHEDREMVRDLPGWDGTVFLAVPAPSTVFRAAATSMGEPEDLPTDLSDDEDVGKSSSLEHLSRQERKALDREIPWRVIVAGPKEIFDLYVAANIKEYESWLSWACIRPLSEERIHEIKNTPSLKRRIIPARNAYQDKNRSAGPTIKAKCRTVVLGCLDPDLATLNRSSPTPTKLAEMILLQLACSGMNKAVEMTDMSWSLWCGDISAAFLQGQPEPRAEPLFMRSPRDAIQQAAKSFPCELYETVGNLYGFASAPRTWWLNVLTTCLKKNFIQHRYDKCLLIKRDAKGLLQVVMIVHVDDFVVMFRSDYDVEELRQMFTWGSTTLLDEKNEIIFRGKEIRMVKTNGKITLKVTQRAFIEEMSCGTLARGRLSAESLDESEWREFRSVAGSLQWLGGQTRPDLCSTVSLANKGRDTKPSDLKTLF